MDTEKGESFLGMIIAAVEHVWQAREEGATCIVSSAVLGKMLENGEEVHPMRLRTNIHRLALYGCFETIDSPTPEDDTIVMLCNVDLDCLKEQL